MGYRTVVILDNDIASEWSNDPLLGKKISHAMNFVNLDEDRRDFHFTPEFRGGVVVESCHMDQQTIAVIDTYSFHALGHSNWTRSDTPESVALRLLKVAADKLGFRLVKKTKV